MMVLAGMCCACVFVLQSQSVCGDAGFHQYAANLWTEKEAC